MNTQLKILAVLSFLVLAGPVFSQSKFQVSLDYHHYLGFYEKGKGYTFHRKDYKMHGNSLRLSGIYFLSQRLGIGAGIGADRYEEPGYNTFPVFTTMHFSPLKHYIPFYLFISPGYALKTNNSFQGAVCDLGAGYKRMFKKHFGMKFDLSYNLKNFRDKAYDTNGKQFTYTATRHSLSIGLGFIF